MDLPELVRDGVLDADLAALCWLMVEGGVPIVVTGDVEVSDRLLVADVLIHLPPAAPALIIDLDAGQPSVTSLASFMRAGMRLAAVAEAPGLKELIEAATGPATGLPEDAVRRLGLVLVVGAAPSVAPGPITDRLRVLAAHYLRPLERDGGGHVQRRPPGGAGDLGSGRRRLRPLRLGRDGRAGRPGRPQPGQLRGAPGQPCGRARGVGRVRTGRHVARGDPRRRASARPGAPSTCRPSPHRCSPRSRTRTSTEDGAGSGHWSLPWPPHQLCRRERLGRS